MNFNPFPEEQGHSELISRLQEIYRMTPEEQASLAHIQARLFPATPIQLQERSPSQPGEPAPSQNGHIVPRTFDHPRSHKVWTRRLNLFAAVLVIMLLSGTFGSAVVLIKGSSRSAVASHQPTPAASLTPMFRRAGAILGSNGFYMVTEQVGWATHPLPGLSLLRTVDGGKTWKRVMPRGLQDGAVARVDVFDEQMAILLLNGDHGHFYRTVDGGTIWQFFAWPGTPGSVIPVDFTETFLDRAHGWVSVSTREPLMMLFRTNDGGQNWQYVSALPAFAYSLSMVWTSLQTAWLTTWGAPHETLYRTRDGGLTWKQVTLSFPPPGTQKYWFFDHLTFFNAQQGALIASFGASSAQYLYTTQDGGNSWQRTGAGLPNNLEVRDYVDATHLAVFKPDDTGGYALAPKGLGFLLTLSKGDWVQASTPITVDYTDIEFLSLQVGLARVNETEVYRTSDGGHTWQLIGTLPRGA